MTSSLAAAAACALVVLLVAAMWPQPGGGGSGALGAIERPGDGAESGSADGSFGASRESEVDPDAIPEPEVPNEAPAGTAAGPVVTRPDDISLVEVADRFMAARAAHDAHGVRALLAADVSIGAAHEWIETPDEYPALLDWERIAGWGFHESDCGAVGPALVVCGYTLTTRLSEALGTGPYTTPRFVLEIRDGLIKRVDHERLGRPVPLQEGDWMVDTWFLAFKPWLAANRADDHAVLFGDPLVESSSLQPAAVSPDSLVLWERSLADFIALLGQVHSDHWSPTPGWNVSHVHRFPWPVAR